MACTRYVFFAFVMLALIQPSNADAAHVVLEFYSDDRSKIIEIPGPDKCSTMVDDDTNFAITAAGERKFLIEARAIREGSALLLVDCGTTTHTYSLTYQNRPKYLFSQDRAFSAQNRPDSHYAASINKSSDGITSGFIELHDMSYPALGLLARQTHADLTSPNKLSRSLDMTHRLPWLDFGYGYETGDNLDNTYTSKRAYLAKAGWSISGAQTSVLGEAFTLDRYTLFIPAPMALRFSYLRNYQGDTERSIERFFGFFYSKSNHQITLTHTDAEFLQLNSSSRYLDIKQVSEWNLKPELDLGYDTRARCLYDQDCRMQSLELFGRATSQAVETKLKYGVVPHSIGADSRWRFGSNHQIALSASKLLAEPEWSKNKKWINADSFESPLQIRNNVHLEYLNHGLRASIDHYVAWIEPDEINEPRLQAAVALEKADWSIRAYAGTAYAKAMEKGVFCGLEVRKYFSDNIKKLQLSMQKHTMSGAVQSNVGLGLADAEVMLYANDQLKSTTRTNKDGAYEFKDIPTSGNLKIVVKADEFTESKTHSKDIFNTSVKLDFKVNNYAEIDVRFVEDVDASGDVSTQDKVLPLKNHIKEINEAVLRFPGAFYKGNKIFVKRQGTIQLILTAELLPFDMVLKSKIPPIDTTKIESTVISLLLGKKN